MTKYTEVLHFNEAFGVEPIETTDPTQHYLIAEELDEYFEALRANDRQGIADALTDMAYLIQGAWIRHGFTPDEQERAWNEVHKSNMAKLQADGTVRRREDGKVLKPDDWKEPDLSFIK